VLLSRTGYTGELGFEIYCEAALALDIWNELLAAGVAMGAAPIGLGARDTLRFEPAFCLYGHELSEEISPLEAGLGWLVKLTKKHFIGRDALLAQKEAGPERKLVGLEPEGRGIARQGFEVLAGDRVIGRITSGTFSPTLGKSLAIGLVSSSLEEGAECAIDIRGRRTPARQVPLPFYRSRSNE
jgi:aminomethyltransferase